MFWWIIIALFAFFIIRSLMNAARGSYYGGGYGWNGVVDEVRLYNRALAASEVTALYNGN